MFMHETLVTHTDTLMYVSSNTPTMSIEYMQAIDDDDIWILSDGTSLCFRLASHLYA